MSAPSTRTSASSNCRAISLKYAGGAGGRQIQQPVFEGEAWLGPFVIAQVPAPGLFESGFERRGAHTQHARGFAHFFSDGRQVEVEAEIGRLAHGIAARLQDGFARDAD